MVDARFFAFAVPGLAGRLRSELGEISGVRVDDAGFDGRSDVVLFTADQRAYRELPRLRLAEDVFVEAGRTLRTEGDRAPWIATRLWKTQRAEQAVGTLSRVSRPIRARASFRVIARVLQERSFVRTELRRQLTATVAHSRPQWRVADPGDVEVWAIEYRPGRFVAGLRASDASMRQHGGRTVERSGALRPTVAAALVGLAGPACGLLLDPCCGSGTILGEAVATGWRAYGGDVDPDAVRVARRNVPDAQVDEWDARTLPLADASVDAVVSNLPFGEQYAVPGDPDRWLRDVLAEALRVTRTDGRIVLLAPRLPRHTVPPEFRLTERIPVRLLGLATIIWAFQVNART